MVAGLLAVQVALNATSMSNMRQLGGAYGGPPRKKPKMKLFRALLWGIIVGVLIACMIALVLG